MLAHGRYQGRDGCSFVQARNDNPTLGRPVQYPKLASAGSNCDTRS
jgi:hypothetical protein